VKLKQAILATLAYHDIFSYPLTLAEICKFSPEKSNLAKTEKELINLVKNRAVGKTAQYYFLKRRANVVKIRKTRRLVSNKKVKKAQIYAAILKLIPTIKMVAVSGALAMGNSTASDDIDFLIISQKNRLWTARFMANVALLPFKRDPKSPKQKDKACLNLFLDEQALRIEEQNLYTAHEICQLKLLWDRNGTYQKFIKSNSWIENYLPNWKPEATPKPFKNKGIHSPLTTHHSSVVENLLKNFQLNYMKSKITTEKIGEHQLFFHPQDTQTKVLKKYNYLTNRLLKNKIHLYESRKTGYTVKNKAGGKGSSRAFS